MELGGEDGFGLGSLEGCWPQLGGNGTDGELSELPSLPPSDDEQGEDGEEDEEEEAYEGDEGDEGEESGESDDEDGEYALQDIGSVAAAAPAGGGLLLSAAGCSRAPKTGRKQGLQDQWDEIVAGVCEEEFNEALQATVCVELAPAKEWDRGIWKPQGGGFSKKGFKRRELRCPFRNKANADCKVWPALHPAALACRPRARPVCRSRATRVPLACDPCAARTQPVCRATHLHAGTLARVD